MYNHEKEPNHAAEHVRDNDGDNGDKFKNMIKNSVI
jgi:hypothetical protein